MADVVAALKHETVKTLGSARLLTVQVEALKLKKIMNFCSAADLNLPVLDNPADYRHRVAVRLCYLVVVSAVHNQ
jgi:hypothetical protein